MVRYIKCPRCELNYIDGDSQEYCDVCIAEMKGNKLKFADLDDEDLNEELDSEQTELCPVCGVNFIRLGETMCETCKKNAEQDLEEEVDPDKDEEWKNYLDDDTEDLSLDGEELEEELKEELDGEEYEDENLSDEEDDFDDDVDSLSDLEDEEFDDDDDEYEDDDDLF